MKEYIDSYLNTIQPKSLNVKKSIKIKQQNNIINEDFEKAKNTFWRTSETKKNEIEDTINNVCTKYNLRPLKVNGKISTTLRGKQEGDFNIRIQLCDPKQSKLRFLWMRGVSCNIIVRITDAENDENISNLDNKQIQVKSSWTEEELTKAINRVLAPAGIKLTGANSPIKLQQIYGGAFKKVQVVDAFTECKAPTDKKVQIAQNLFRGWEKLDDNELQEFAKLYKLANA